MPDDSTTATAPVQAQTQQQTDAQEQAASKVRLEDMEVTDPAHRQAKEKILLRIEEFNYKQRLARLFSNSGAFADIKGESEAQSIAKAFIKIELGESMGFSPAESMTGIDIIQGRVAVGANLRAARMQSAGYGWPRMSLTDDGCSIPLEYKGKPMMAPRLDTNGAVVVGSDGNPVMDQVVIAYGKKDAEKGGLIGKDNYKKNPRNMYFARAITNAQRWFAPSVLKADLLSQEEAEDLTNDPTPWSYSAAPAQVATQEKTVALADKLKAKREKPQAAVPMAGINAGPLPDANGLRQQSANKPIVVEMPAEKPTPPQAGPSDAPTDMF